MRSLPHRLRRVFITGLLVSLPLVITIVVFKFLFESVDNFLGPVISQLLIAAGAPIDPGFVVPGLGLIATMILVFLVGLASTNYLGRKLWELGEWTVTRIPVIRSIYSGAKQVIDTFALSGNQSFSKVALIEYPRKGMYSLAFVTGEMKGEIKNRAGRELVSVFLPTTPNPTSGFLLLVPREDIVELEMTVEEGIKMIISGGVVTPASVRKGA